MRKVVVILLEHSRDLMLQLKEIHDRQSMAGRLTKRTKHEWTIVAKADEFNR